MATIRLQREDFDAGAEAAQMARGRTDVGAVVTFAGICRDHEAGHGVAALTRRVKESFDPKSIFNPGRMG